MNCQRLRALYIMLLIGCLQGVTSAQSSLKCKVGEVKSRLLESPQFRDSYQKRWTPQDWLELECEMRWKERGREMPAFLDQVRITWYVIGRRTKELVQSEVRYKNVLMGRDYRYSCYLSPSDFMRLTKSVKPREGDVLRFGGEVFCGAHKVQEFTSAGEIGWWKKVRKRSAQVTLLSKAETPFRDFWWDSYAEAGE